MMIQSMTGYSRATRHTPQELVTVELRSTNHRYLEIGHRLPDGLVEFEGQIAQLIRSHVRRGRIEVSVTVQGPRGTTRRVALDEALAQAYHERLLELKSRLGLKGSLTLDHVLALPQVLSVTDDQAQRQALWPDIRQALQAALRKLLTMRRAEGRRLIKDIRVHLRLIKARLAVIRARLPKSAAQQRQRLQHRLKAMLGDAPAAASSALIQEALALIRDTDIHEELVRLDSHLTHVEQTLRGQPSVGKTLDFIAQELMRETNTMGAKANDAIIARCVIEIKGAIEKIREQAQNLE